MFLTIILITGFRVHEKKIEVLDADWNQAKTAFEELNQALKNENGDLWNYSLKTPVMLVNRDTRTFIANENDKTGELLTSRENLYVGKLPESCIIANTAFDWNGKRWTMVAFPLPNTKEERLNLLIHESFHQIQPAIGFDSFKEKQSVHLDTKLGRIYLKLELEALKKALTSNNPAVHIHNALLFRQYRYQNIPDAKQAENSLELNEGLAEYTGSILSERTESDLIKHYISEIDRFYAMPSFVRSFAYITIPVYGYFMKQADTDWNLQITKNTNLTDYMFRFWNIESQGLKESVIMQMGKQYGIDSIIENETQREVAIEELKQNYTKTFLSDSTVQIAFENMRYGFDPNNIMPLDTLGTVFPNFTVTDNWGILQVDSCGALVSPRWDKVTVSSPLVITDTLIAGKGWKLRLDKSRKLVFSNKKYIVK